MAQNMSIKKQFFYLFFLLIPLNSLQAMEQRTQVDQLRKGYREILALGCKLKTLQVRDDGPVLPGPAISFERPLNRPRVYDDLVEHSDDASKRPRVNVVKIWGMLLRCSYHFKIKQSCAKIAKFENLINLELPCTINRNKKGCALTGEDLAPVLRLPYLKKLFLFRCARFSILEEIAQHCNLEELSIAPCRNGRISIGSFLKKWNKKEGLKRLALIRCRIFKIKDIDLLPHSLEKLEVVECEKISESALVRKMCEAELSGFFPWRVEVKFLGYEEGYFKHRDVPSIRHKIDEAIQSVLPGIEKEWEFYAQLERAIVQSNERRQGIDDLKEQVERMRGRVEVLERRPRLRAPEQQAPPDNSIVPDDGFEPDDFIFLERNQDGSLNLFDPGDVSVDDVDLRSDGFNPFD